MERILITGFTGFVSKYLVDALTQSGRGFEILGVSRKNSFDSIVNGIRVHVLKLDLNDRKYVDDVLAYFKPTQIFHLASDSSVSYSWDNPVGSFQNNTNIFLNLIESVRKQKLDCRVLSVGSSEEYGVVNNLDLPLKEEAPLNPISPYAVARVSQEMLSKVFARGYGMDIILTRSFNHIGAGQKSTFVISSFAKQIALIKKGRANSVEVGDLTIVRDFLDVGDVVKAYISLMDKGVSGEVYNICSGLGHSLENVLDKMKVISNLEFEIKINPSFIRPIDNPVIIGCNKKVTGHCGWIPNISLNESLEKLINYWENIVDLRIKESNNYA